MALSPADWYVTAVVWRADPPLICVVTRALRVAFAPFYLSNTDHKVETNKQVFQVFIYKLMSIYQLINI